MSNDMALYESQNEQKQNITLRDKVEIIHM